MRIRLRRIRFGRRRWALHNPVMDSPFFYLVIFTAAIIFLGRLYANAAGTKETAADEDEPQSAQISWQTVWEEMNPAQKDVIDVSDENEEDVTDFCTEETEALTKSDEEAENTETEVSVQSSSVVRQNMQLCIENLGLNMEELCDFDYLFNQFYTLNSGTSITADELDARTLLSKDLSLSHGSDTPQILIYHTHSQEAYANSREGVVEDTVTGVGEYLAEILSEEYGYNVIHDTQTFDVTDGKLDRDMSYQRALPAVQEILEKYPGIEVVIDLHRDGVRDDVRLVTDIDGSQCAKIMFFNGVCRDENGELKDLTNPYISDNLAFSLQMRLASMLISGDFCRTNYLKTWRYNQHVAGRCLLVEVGAQTNTVEEAKNACVYLAEALSYVLE